jgi:hypothetical protein
VLIDEAQLARQMGGTSGKNFSACISTSFLIFLIIFLPLENVTERHWLNMELDLQSLFGLRCTAVLIG